MNKSNIILNRENEVKFFDNIFYWLWHFTLKGLPDRVFVVISVLQYAYFIFIIAIVLQFLNDEIIIWLYQRRESTIINLPIISVFLLLFCLNMKIYTKKEYMILKEKYLSMDMVRVRKYKKTFFIFMFMTVAIVIIEIKLLTVYYGYVRALLEY